MPPRSENRVSRIVGKMNVFALLSVVLLVLFNQVDVASSFAWWVIDRRALVLFARPDSTLTRFVSRSPPQEALRRSRGVRVGIPPRQALVRCAVQFVRRRSAQAPADRHPSTDKHRQAPTSSKREERTAHIYPVSPLSPQGIHRKDVPGTDEQSSSHGRHRFPRHDETRRGGR